MLKTSLVIDFFCSFHGLFIIDGFFIGFSLLARLHVLDYQGYSSYSGFSNSWKWLE